VRGKSPPKCPRGRAAKPSPSKHNPQRPAAYTWIVCHLSHRAPPLPQLLRVYDDGHVEFIRFVWAKFDMHEAVKIGHPKDLLMLEVHIASLSHRLARA
jgi:hypothetical protein